MPEHPDHPTTGHPSGLRQVAEQLTRRWWLWLVFGTLWIIGALIVVQFWTASLATVGVIIGVLLLVAGVQELVMAGGAQSWRWLSVLVGVVFLVAGVWALMNPIRTFVVVAEMLGFLFVLIGVFWTIEAFVTRPENDLWFLSLLAGILLIVLGFWADGQFIAARASLLLTVVGIWALLQGITDLTRAFPHQATRRPAHRRTGNGLTMTGEGTSWRRSRAASTDRRVASWLSGRSSTSSSSSPARTFAGTSYPHSRIWWPNARFTSLTGS